MNSPIRVALLGPPAVRVGNEVVPIAGTKLQSVLALLALAAPHPVPDGRLVEELWGDAQPANAANALQALVSHLRRVLGRGAIVRQGCGYSLDVDPDQVDAIRLERLVRQGREESARGEHAAAVQRFRAALGLIRGEPFAELIDRWFARDAAARSEEIALSAHEGLIDSELAMGRHAEVLSTVSELVVVHPLRERFRAQLIIALYRCGRQADALAAYRTARDYLLDELGLDPGRELRALERSVLAQDPALDAPIAVVSPLPGPASLPFALTSFVGRERELTELSALLHDERLVSLVGPAGVGKSRLALELARGLADDQEVWFVELAPVVDAGAVAEAVAIAVGAPERLVNDGRVSTAPAVRVIERLRDRPAIVVIDNCEQVAAAVADIVRQVLLRCSRAWVLATSREPLHVDGEHQLAVAPLTETEAAVLFVERARAVQPHAASGTDREHIATLVRHLDRLPLAIELAAARTKTLPVLEIISRLDDRFRLLRQTSRGAPDRHDGLEAAIAWSYDMLFADERRTFRELSVCPGGITTDLAERLCGPDALELASRLVDRSLLVADTSGSAVRFTMLESLRAYGQARLEECAETESARADHLSWCLELATIAHRETRGPAQLAWLARLDQEHDNVRAALGHAVSHDPDLALRLVGELVLPWWFRGRRQEIREWVDAALAAAGAVRSPGRGRVLAWSGLVAEPGPAPGGSNTDPRAELELAESRGREALAIDTENGDAEATAYDCLLLLSTLTRQTSMSESATPPDAASLYARGQELFDRLGDDFGSGVIRITDAMLAIADGDLARADARVEAASPFVDRLGGERFSSSRLEYVRGMLEALAGVPRAAYGHIERSLRLANELGIHHAVTAQARLLVHLAERSGEDGLAAQWRSFVEGRGAGWTHYDASVMASAYTRVGMRARAHRQLARAESAHRAALDWYRAAGLSEGVALSESSLGFLALDRHDDAGATRHHRAAFDAAVESKDDACVALALEGAAVLATRAGDSARAAQLLGAARTSRADTVVSPATHRDDIDDVEERLQSVLGSEHLARLMELGARLERRAVLAMARSG